MPHRSPQVIAPSKKPALILVHGFRGSPLGLETIAKDLRQHGYEVYLPAIPPFAGSQPLAAYTPENYARFLKNYITEHQLTRPILIGHSMGSVIVSATAKFFPDHVNHKLILLSPIATRPSWPFRLVSPLTAIVPNNIVDYITTKYLFVPHDQPLFQQTMDLTHRCSHDQPPTKSQIAAATTFSTKYSVRNFTTNQAVAIIAGEKDRLVGKANITKLAEDLQARLTFLPNSGHLHNYEQPHATADAILEFLAS